MGPHGAVAAVEQIEQDLMLSRLIVEIANDPYLSDELVFRGGTCLHSMHLNRSATARTTTTSAAPAAGSEKSPERLPRSGTDSAWKCGR